MHRGLLEREREVDELGGLIEAARRGSGGFVVVEGPAGIGKTRLIEEGCRAAGSAGMDVLRGRGLALEDQFALGVVRQLLEGALAATPEIERRELMGGAAALGGALLGFAQPGGGPAAADASFASLHGLYWLCFNLAQRRPLFVAVDDAHWADAASLRFVSFLAARLQSLPIVLLLALRPREPGTVNPVLETIRSNPEARVLRLAELSEAACTRVIADAFGVAPAQSFARACWEVTGGNPFYLRGLVDALRFDGVSPDAQSAWIAGAQVPDTVVRALLLRLSRLPRAAPALARAVAVLGADIELRDAAQLAALGVGEAAAAADLLADAGILAAGRPLRFRHPILAGVVYADLAPGERSRMHAESARMLAASGAAAERTASHLLATEPSGDPWAVEVLRAAATDAVSRGAPDSAVTYLERARREGVVGAGAAGLLWELGSAEFLMGRPVAIEHLRAALGSGGELVERAGIARDLGSALANSDRSPEAVAVLEAAIAEFDGADPGLARVLEAELLGAAALHLSTRAGHIEHLARVSARDLGDSPAERMLLAHVALWTSCAGERASVVRGMCERAVAGGRLLAEVTSDAQTFYCVTNGLLYCDSLELARYWFDQGLADAARRGSIIGFALGSCFRSQTAYRLGELDDAEADARSALAAAGEDRWVSAPAAVAYLVDVLIERGGLGEARALLGRCQIPFGLDHTGMSHWVPYARGQLALAAGEWTLAARSFEHCRAWFTAWGERNPGLLDWRTGAALAHAKLGERDHARELTGEVVALSRSLGQPRCLGVGLRAAGIVAGGADGVELLREAVTVLVDTPARLEHGRALIDLGAALRRQNHRKDARGPLRAGIDLADRCGATVLAQRGRDELIATGARPRRMAASGADSLTPSERRVAQLAADGLSNPQVAQQLFVTVNTVESHLRHAYMKLDIHSRGELAGALAASRKDAVKDAASPAAETAMAAGSLR